MKKFPRNRGFTLIELALAVGIAAVLTTAVTQLVMAASSSYQLQQNLGALQENVRFAFDTMKSEIEAGGYRAQPWDVANSGWSVDGQDNVSPSTDRVTVRRWSNTNCFDNPNPVTDENGKARFYLRETSFIINNANNLAQTCKYGPGSTQLTTQINNLGVVENAEAMQVLYAEDTDADGHADRWISAGQWIAESNVIAVKIGLLMATPKAATRTVGNPLQVLDTIVIAPADGRLRKAFEAVIAIRGRQI